MFLLYVAVTSTCQLERTITALPCGLHTPPRSRGVALTSYRRPGRPQLVSSVDVRSSADAHRSASQALGEANLGGGFRLP